MASAAPSFAWPWFVDEMEPNTAGAMQLGTSEEHEGKSQVYSLVDGRQLSLNEYLDIPSTDRWSALVAIECTRELTRREIFESNNNLRTLQSTWNIPGPVIRLAFTYPAEHYNTPFTEYSAAGGVTWYICPFSAILSSVFQYTPGYFNVVFGVQHNKPPGEQQPLNILTIIGHSDESRRNVQLANIQKTCREFAENNSIKVACSSTKVMCFFGRLLHRGFHNWAQNFYLISACCSELCEMQAENAKVFLQADLALRFEGEIENVADLRHDIGPAIELVNFLLSKFTHHPPLDADPEHCNINIRCVEALEYERQRLQDMRAHFDRLHGHLQRQLQMAIYTVQINQNSLTQANNIAVRKLAEESQLGAQSMQKLTEQSLADARHMKHLAYLNMAFLPSAVIAAIFSTPFLALDDQLSFRAISRIWILLLVCVSCTALTFAMSWLLGMINGKTPSPTADADRAAEDIVPEADRAILDRPRQPNLEAELIDWDDLYKRAIEEIHAAAGNSSGAEAEEDSDREEDIHE